MDKNKIRAYAIAGIITTIILVLIVYGISNSDFFKFKGNVLKQKQKTGIGYVRTGRVEYNAPTVFLLGDFTANMATNDRAGKFVRVEIRLEMSDKDMSDELKQKNIRLRDAVIDEMSLKRFSQISTEKGKEELKENIRNRINTIVNDGEIKEVYFTQFIIQ